MVKYKQKWTISKCSHYIEYAVNKNIVLITAYWANKERGGEFFNKVACLDV